MSLLPQRKRMKGVGRVAFMARLDDITADLEAGWPIKAVYQKCSDKLGMSYAQFARTSTGSSGRAITRMPQTASQHRKRQRRHTIRFRKMT